MFSNTKSVEINGKEIKSIILENGAILYEKENPYILSITSDKDILSYYDNDVATLTASLTKDSTPIEGEEVIFYTPNVTIGTEKYSAQDYNYIKMNLEGDGEIILPNSTQFSVQAFTEDGTNVVWEDLSKGDWKIKINNGELNFCLGTNASPSEQSSFVGNKFSIKIFSKTSNDLYEISSSYPVFFASAITQNNGQCSVVYNSQGIGDVLINVECMNLQETYELEDCHYWNENGVSYNSTSSTDRRVLSGLESMEYTPSGDFEVSFTLEASTYGKRLYLTSKGQSTTTSNFYGIGGDIDTSYCNLILRTTSSSGSPTTRTNPATFKFVIEGSNIQMYCNNELIATKTALWFTDYAPYVFSWGIWNTGSVSATNIKIKPL